MPDAFPRCLRRSTCVVWTVRHWATTVVFLVVGLHGGVPSPCESDAAESPVPDLVTPRSDEVTGFQEAGAYRPRSDLRTDFVMAYGVDASLAGSLAALAGSRLCAAGDDRCRVGRLPRLPRREVRWPRPIGMKARPRRTDRRFCTGRRCRTWCRRWHSAVTWRRACGGRSMPAPWRSTWRNRSSGPGRVQSGISTRMADLLPRTLAAARRERGRSVPGQQVEVLSLPAHAGPTLLPP